MENYKGEAETSWWAKRSKMEKKLVVFSAVSVLFIVTLVIVIIVIFTQAPTTCLTPGCVHITDELLEHMDTEANPCQDFYQFTCGSFLEDVQLDEEPRKSVLSLLYDTIHDRIRGIMEEPEERDDLRSIRLAKTLYMGCMNESAIEDKGLRLIKDSIRQIGGWPVVEGNEWKEREFEWKTASYKLRELGYGFEFFIAFAFPTDQNDVTKRIIQFYMPYNSLSVKDEDEEIFHDMLVNISVAFGADRERAKNEFRDVAEFIKNLFPVKNDDDENEEGTDDQQDVLTISELQYKLRDIPWLEYINRLSFPAPNVSYEQVVKISDMPYFLRLQNALRRTPKRVLANYIAWRTVADQAMYLSSDVTEPIWKFIRRSHKDYVEPPRPKFCAQTVENIFFLTLEAEYIKQHFSMKTKKHVADMLQSIKEEYRDVLHDLEWMDDETRAKALERLTGSKNHIGFPNELLNTKKVEEVYVGMQMEEDNFLASLLNANYYETNSRFRELHEPTEKNEFTRRYATYSRSYYTADDNTITVPAGLLQGVIYDDHRPQYLNYGALGSILGHELFHTVFEGKSCRKESKYYDFLSTATMLAFNEKLSCVAMHYGKYFVPESKEHLNSSNTKYEDIADIAGVKLAYDAYSKWVSNNGEEQQLPGLDYTPKQLFWISSAIRFCSKSTPEALESSIAHSYTSPGKYRVLGTLRNLEEFSKDFNCPANSYMNNDDQCEIW